METPLNSAKDKLNENKSLIPGDQAIQVQVNNGHIEPVQANGDGIDADFVEDDNELQNVELEKKLFAEADNFITSNNFEAALGRITKLLASNEANPEALKKKALCETKLERFIDAISSLQKAVDLDTGMKCALTSYTEYKLNKQYLIKSNDI